MNYPKAQAQSHHDTIQQRAEGASGDCAQSYMIMVLGLPDPDMTALQQDSNYLNQAQTYFILHSCPFVGCRWLSRETERIYRKSLQSSLLSSPWRIQGTHLRWVLLYGQSPSPGESSATDTSHTEYSEACERFLFSYALTPEYRASRTFRTFTTCRLCLQELYMDMTALQCG